MMNTTNQPIPDIPLTAHHIRFTVRAETPIAFHGFKGSALRGAFAGTLRRAFCPEAQRQPVDPLHKAICPACQLLDAEQASRQYGDIRRPYAIRPPLDGKQNYLPGELLHFDVVLFGDKLTYFPYLIMTVQRMGAEAGVGRRDQSGQRGRFSIQRVEAINPLTGELQLLLEAGDSMVRLPALPITHAQVLTAAGRLLTALEQQNKCLTVHCRTPMRLMSGGQKVETAEFFPLAKQAVLRVLDLSAQHAGARPDIRLKEDIYPFADRVMLVKDETHWWDLKGYSGRLERRQVLGGLMGRAVYRTEEWQPLLPWLMWGQIVQVGKNIVKGCGIYQLEAGAAITNPTNDSGT